MMNMRKSMIGMAALLALSGSGMLAASPSMETDASPGPGEATIRTRHRPSGNTPVPGGGAKERAKRIARMEKAASKAAAKSRGEA